MDVMVLCWSEFAPPLTDSFPPSLVEAYWQSIEEFVPIASSCLKSFNSSIKSVMRAPISDKFCWELSSALESSSSFIFRISLDKEGWSSRRVWSSRDNVLKWFRALSSWRRRSGTCFLMLSERSIFEAILKNSQIRY